jgi:prephenate dehydrogenase/chorismate mutase
VVKLDKIHELRKKIDEIDEEIVRLLDKRMEIVSEIGSVKKYIGKDVRDLSRETEILDKVGIYKDIFREIIRLSVAIQVDTLYGERQSKDCRSIGIVGFGKMGRLFARLFSRYNEIGIYDIKKTLGEGRYNVYSSLRELVRDVEYILVSTPLSETPNVVSRIRKIILSEKLMDKKVFDIATIKERVVKELEKFPRYTAVCSIHPLFGGNVVWTKNKRIVIVPIRGREEDCRYFIEILKPFEFNIVYASQEEHDVAIAYTIGLPYYIGLAYGETILNMDREKLSGFGGTSYSIFSSYISDIVFNDKPEFIETLLSNAFTKEAIEDFISRVSKDQSTKFNKDIIRKLMSMWRKEQHIEEGDN